MFDALDFKIVRMLQKDARISFVDIAKELKVSPGLVQARFNKMKKAGLIKGSTLILNSALMPIKNFSIGIRALDSELEEVVKYLNGLEIDEVLVLSWITFGLYNISALIISKDVFQVHRLKQLIQKHPAVKDVVISINNTVYYSENVDLTRTFKE